MGTKAISLLFLCLMLASFGLSEELPTLPSSYQTIIEINVDNKHYSLLQREFKDGDNKRGTIWQLREDKASRVIVDEKNKQAFHIFDSNGTCTVTDLNVLNPKDFPFGGTNKATGHFLYSTDKVMEVAKKNGIKLINDSAIVRGMTVKLWSTDFSFNNKNFNLQMSFAVRTWKTAGGYEDKPVRFVLTENSTSPDAIKHNYEYYTFYPRIRDNPESIFEIPSGVICKKRKGNKKIPKLPMYFSYRQEAVYDDYVKVSDIWYDENDRFLRIDYRPGGIENTMSAALSEIHDYNTGVLYKKNLYLGNCSTSTLSNSSFGTEQNATSWKKDKSYEIMLKNPLQYFYLDSNYVYIGKKKTRSIDCDVFASTRNSFPMPNGKSYPVVLEFYFASDDYEIMPDKANNITSQVPVMLLVSSQDKSLDFSLRINIVDFNEKQHDFSVFDISSCYSNAAKMHVSILLDGQYVEATKEEIIGEGQVLIADLMKIQYNRVQNIHMSRDASTISLYASILDRSPSTAQFSHISIKPQTVVGDATLKGVNKMPDCADKCVKNTNFVCNGFYLCGNDCILSKTHVAKQSTDGGMVICSHYSRTVDGPPIVETGLSSAWNNLRNAIGMGKFLLDIPNQTGDSLYKALYARLDVGVILKLEDLPKLSSDIKYKEEIVSPSQKDVQPISVFYSASKNLTRFDSWKSQPSISGAGPVETIQDFQIGVQYVLDTITGECHIEHIQPDTFDVINENPSKQTLTKMKDVMALFYLNGSYSFVGQKDVRGIMTDVFEAWRTDFSGSNHALFRYHFLSKNWNSVSHSIPMRLEIVADLDTYYSVYNFFEFMEEPVAMSNFDVTSCYRESNKINDFQITFEGEYNQQPANFIFAVISLIKQYTHVSGIRIQEPELFSHNQKTFFQASLLEPPPSIAMFNRIPQKSIVSKKKHVLKNVQSEEACADECVEAKYLNCNAFQFCQGSMQCELHERHFGSSHWQDSETCSFFTRTEDAPMDMLSANDIMTDLINLARKGMFKITFTVAKTTYHFTAKSILTNIDRNNSRNIASVQNMESYKRSYEGAFLKQYGSVFMKVSVDDCALKCTQSQSLNCEAFSYCYLQGQCLLSENRPTNDSVEVSTWCDVYERNYLNLFEELPGRTFPMEGDVQLTKVTNPDVCARRCANDGIEKCQSFEYCETFQACSFSKRHTMDVPSSNIITSVKCSVYSLTFLKDFQKASTKIESLVDNVLIKDVSVKQCARICLTDEGLNCPSFDYCPSEHICRITGYDEKGSGQTSVMTKANCTHYIRKDKKVLPPVAEKQHTKGNKGTAAALGIGMFVIGGILGLLVIYLIHRKDSLKKDDHMKVNFLKLEDQ